MDDYLALDIDKLPADLQALMTQIEAVATARQGDEIALLELLRTLEQLHRGIREGLFREALPTNRQRLYHLLRDIEVSGGWPYIQRMRLRSLLANMEEMTVPEQPLSTQPPTEPTEER
jgi:hypothetical protein